MIDPMHLIIRIQNTNDTIYYATLLQCLISILNEQGFSIKRSQDYFTSIILLHNINVAIIAIVVEMYLLVYIEL